MVLIINDVINTGVENIPLEESVLVIWVTESDVLADQATLLVESSKALISISIQINKNHLPVSIAIILQCICSENNLCIKNYIKNILTLYIV